MIILNKTEIANKVRKIGVESLLERVFGVIMSFKEHLHGNRWGKICKVMKTTNDGGVESFSLCVC